MKHLKRLSLILALVHVGCNQKNHSSTIIEKDQPGNTVLVQNANDRDQNHKLINQVLRWADSKNSIDLLPAITDTKDSVYIGFDLDKHRQNLEKLRTTNFFATEFIDNYDQIILTLDKRLIDKEYQPWRVGYLPSFGFANDSSPWCNCQDYLDWDLVQVKVHKLTSNQGELVWYWGELGPGYDSSWKEFEYSFRVVKENDNWKISYLEGFDLQNAQRKAD